MSISKFPPEGTNGTCSSPRYWPSENKYYPCGKPATLQRDPFLSEVFDQEEYRFFCEDCYEQRCDDI